MPHQDKSRIAVNKQVNPNLSYRIFKWYELGYLGVGESGQPFADMSPWIDMDCDMAKEAEAEVTALVGKFKTHHFPKNGAYVPEDINGKKWLNWYVWNAETALPNDVRMSFTKPIDVSNWIYENGLVPLDWKQMGYIVRPNLKAWDSDGHLNFDKIRQDGVWLEDTPVLKRWIESWNIFDDIGRMVVFQNSPGDAVGIHRDTAFFPNSMQNLSIQFRKDRPSFVYDEKAKEKIYHRTQAYCFNISDNHGVDATDYDAYTIRMDGVFKPEICRALGLTDGKIWTPSYKSAQKIRDIQIFEPDERP